MLEESLKDVEPRGSSHDFQSLGTIVLIAGLIFSGVWIKGVQKNMEKKEIEKQKQELKVKREAPFLKVHNSSGRVKDIIPVKCKEGDYKIIVFRNYNGVMRKFLYEGTSNYTIGNSIDFSYDLSNQLIEFGCRESNLSYKKSPDTYQSVFNENGLAIIDGVLR